MEALEQAGKIHKYEQAHAMIPMQFILELLVLKDQVPDVLEVNHLVQEELAARAKRNNACNYGAQANSDVWVRSVMAIHARSREPPDPNEPAQKGRQWTYGKPRKEKFKLHRLSPHSFDDWMLVVKRGVGISHGDVIDAARLQHM